MALADDGEIEPVPRGNFAAQRYCSVPFPPYRFTPGKDPHPTADPRGHSYHPPGSAHPHVTLVSPEDWADSTEYLYGCDLYNHAYWWEAHEAWEGLWQVTDKNGAQGRFLQGLIQAAACHLKRHTGHVKGVERLRRTSLENLGLAASATSHGLYMGLDVDGFMQRLRAYHGAPEHILETATGHDLATYPYIQLDRSSAGA